MTQSNQNHTNMELDSRIEDQAVATWMESLGFTWLPFNMWRPPEKGLVERNISPDQALFFYTICQKAEREGRADELKHVRIEGFKKHLCGSHRLCVIRKNHRGYDVPMSIEDRFTQLSGENNAK